MRQHLEALLALKKDFAKSFNETEREHALRVAFRKGRWGELVAKVPKPEQVEENLKAADIKAKLTSEVLGKIEKILDNQPRFPIDFR